MSPANKLLLHYHFFKNAGTSVDSALKRNFGALWINIEFQGPPVTHAEKIQAFILENPSLLAISSHTLLSPVPVIAGLTVLPILFIRHPVDRLKSAYEFERVQPVETFGAKLAKRVDFVGYLEARWENRHDRSSLNAQAYRLARIMGQPDLEERRAAFAALDELPFIGLVEAFDASGERLERLAQQLYPSFRHHSVQANARRDPTSPLKQRLAGIRNDVGDEFYRRIEEHNDIDLDLHEEICRRYGVNLDV